MRDYNITYAKALEGMRNVLQYIGEDPDREGLLDTPKRVLKAHSEMLAGYTQDPSEILQRVFKDGIDYEQMIVVKNIPFVSMCEHHMLAFKGIAHVGYLPRDSVVGLSKIPRVVDVFAKRLQVQERLTDNIADAIQDHLNPLGVGVIIESEHTCMTLRGAKKMGTTMITTALRGSFLEANHKNEFYTMIKG